MSHPTYSHWLQLANRLTTREIDDLLHAFRCPSCGEEFRYALEDTRGGRGESKVQWGEGGAVARVLPWRSPREMQEFIRTTVEELPGEEIFHLVATFVDQTEEGRRELARTEAQVRTYEFVDALLDAAWAQTLEAPAEAEALAHWGFALAKKVPVDSLTPKETLYDLQARAWAYIANSRRMRSDLQGGAAAIKKAEWYLARGSQEAMERGRVLWLKGSLLRAQRKFEEAIRVCDRAVEAYREVGQPELVGRVLTTMALISYETGRTDKAIRTFYEALEYIDPATEEYLYLCIHHNLILASCDLERYTAARSLLQEVEPLYRKFRKPRVHLRHRWVQGRLALGFGDLKPAEEALLEARDGFLREGIPYEAALVSLDLCALYLRQGRNAEVIPVAEKILAVFKSLEVDREALAAWISLHRAATGRTLTRDLLRDLTRRLRAVGEVRGASGQKA